jgi:dTDP-4-amino-4,6-dideoxygalactose transaminase
VRFSKPLAIGGGTPVFPDGAPHWPIPDAAVQQALCAAWESGDWGRYHGPFCERLATELALLHQVEFVQLCCSGTFAVELALRAVGVGRGDEVILAGYDFPGNFRAIEAIGAVPVLVDLAPQRWTLDPDQVPLARSEKTRAVLVSHLHGSLASLRKLRAFADHERIALVEDACQSPGAVYDGKIAGTWGDVGVLSFGGSKLLTAGRGGAILTNRPELHQRAKIFCDRGNQAFPLSELQAAVLAPQVRLLTERNALRRNRFDRLAQRLSALRGIQLLDPFCSTLRQPAFYKVGLRFVEEQLAGVARADYVAAMQAEGVALDTGFRGFTKRSERRCRRVGELPHSQRAVDSTLVLHHPILLQPEESIDRLAEAFHKVSAALAGS